MRLHPRVIGALIAAYFLAMLLLLLGPAFLADDGRDDPGPLPTGVHTMSTPISADYL